MPQSAMTLGLIYLRTVTRTQLTLFNRMSTPPFDPAQAHRWFAVEYNNTTWDLLEMTDRTNQENLVMMHTAHASSLHWQEAGTEIHQLRSYYLLTYVYSAVGNGAAATLYGEQTLELLEQKPEGIADWDVAFVYDALSKAYRTAGKSDEEAHYRALAQEAENNIADADDRAIYVAMKERP